MTEAIRLCQRAIELADGDPVMGSLIIGSPLAMMLAMRATSGAVWDFGMARRFRPSHCHRPQCRPVQLLRCSPVQVHRRFELGTRTQRRSVARNRRGPWDRTARCRRLSRSPTPSSRMVLCSCVATALTASRVSNYSPRPLDWVGSIGTPSSRHGAPISTSLRTRFGRVISTAQSHCAATSWMRRSAAAK